MNQKVKGIGIYAKQVSEWHENGKKSDHISIFFPAAVF